MKRENIKKEWDWVIVFITVGVMLGFVIGFVLSGLLFN
jgi:hypothetical protein